MSETQSEQHLKQIVDIQLNRVRERLQDRRITLELTETAKEHLVRVGYDPTYGARPLKRAIQRELETALGRQLLRGDIRDGDAVLVDYDPNLRQLTFRPKERAHSEDERVAAAVA